MVSVPRNPAAPARNKSPVPPIPTSSNVVAGSAAVIAVSAAADFVAQPAAITSEEELIASGEITVVQPVDVIVEPPTATAETYDISTPVEPAPEPMEGSGLPSPARSESIKRSMSPLSPAADGVQERSSGLPSPSVEDSVDSPSVIESVGHQSLNEQPSGDETENLVSMLEAPPKGALRHASDDEHEDAQTIDARGPDIPDIPDA